MQKTQETTVQLARNLVKDVGVKLPEDCDAPSVEMGGTNSVDLTLGCKRRCSRPCPLPEKPISVHIIREKQTRRTL